MMNRKLTWERLLARVVWSGDLFGDGPAQLVMLYLLLESRWDGIHPKALQAQLSMDESEVARVIEKLEVLELAFWVDKNRCYAAQEFMDLHPVEVRRKYQRQRNARMKQVREADTPAG